MNAIRSVRKSWKSRPTTEGAGVNLRRAFGYYEARALDPFLLLDDFHSDNAADYIAGFPTHPHRGIETITYMLHGRLRHKDSLGNAGVINPGEVQWMTAGSGIVHEEMPEQTEGTLAGFQLWANLPASLKMTPPKYRQVSKSDIPEIEPKEGVKVRVVAGEIDGTKGPVQDVLIEPQYLDVEMGPNRAFDHTIPRGHTAFAYIYEGTGFFDDNEDSFADRNTLVLFGDGDKVKIRSSEPILRFLLVSGSPLNEPIAWNGPIVMNTEEELSQAFREYRDGTFLKHRTAGAGLQ